LSNVPISQPYYAAPFGAAVRRFWTKYATFRGRASRAEYWWWALVAAVVGVILEIIGLASGSMGSTLNTTTGMATPGPGFGIFGIVALLWGLATIVPSLALLWRRLHDANYSGLFALLALIPFVGGIIVLVFTLLPPNPQGARFD
jgi:uncharacterized membrane protein YhaH (DUF805 family)